MLQHVIAVRGFWNCNLSTVLQGIVRTCVVPYLSSGGTLAHSIFQWAPGSNAAVLQVQDQHGYRERNKPTKLTYWCLRTSHAKPVSLGNFLNTQYPGQRTDFGEPRFIHLPTLRSTMPTGFLRPKYLTASHCTIEKPPRFNTDGNHLDVTNKETAPASKADNKNSTSERTILGHPGSLAKTNGIRHDKSYKRLLCWSPQQLSEDSSIVGVRRKRDCSPNGQLAGIISEKSSGQYKRRNVFCGQSWGHTGPLSEPNAVESICHCRVYELASDQRSQLPTSPIKWRSQRRTCLYRLPRVR